MAAAKEKPTDGADREPQSSLAYGCTDIAEQSWISVQNLAKHALASERRFFKKYLLIGLIVFIGHSRNCSFYSGRHFIGFVPFASPWLHTFVDVLAWWNVDNCSGTAAQGSQCLPSLWMQAFCGLSIWHRVPLNVWTKRTPCLLTHVQAPSM